MKFKLPNISVRMGLIAMAYASLCAAAMSIGFAVTTDNKWLMGANWLLAGFNLRGAMSLYLTELQDRSFKRMTEIANELLVDNYRLIGDSAQLRMAASRAIGEERPAAEEEKPRLH